MVEVKGADQILRRFKRGAVYALACFLAALTPWVGAGRAAACPWEEETYWYGNIVSGVGHTFPADVAYVLLHRSARIASRLHLLETDAVERIRVAIAEITLREAMTHTRDPDVTRVAARVLDWVERGEPDSGRERLMEEAAELVAALRVDPANDIPAQAVARAAQSVVTWPDIAHMTDAASDAMIAAVNEASYPEQDMTWESAEAKAAAANCWINMLPAIFDSIEAELTRAECQH